jgi:hypothetical protein
MIASEIDPEDETTRSLWNQVGELADALPDGWVLVGGLMVQLHAFEHGVTAVRVTRDIDLLGQARTPGKLQALDQSLREAAFELSGLDLDGYGYRYERDGMIVDLLAPDGMRNPPAVSPGIKAIGVPGGSQALTRAEPVKVITRERSYVMRRPSLTGAILIKARSLMVHSDPDSQREDLLRLLSLVPDPRATAREITVAERRWLAKAEHRLDLSAPSLLDRDAARTAALTFRLLSRASRGEQAQ